MAALAAATIALEMAAGKIDADIEEMTKTYLDELKRFIRYDLKSWWLVTYKIKSDKLLVVYL
jgi:hypothetical protein